MPAMTPITIDKAYLKFIENSGFNGFPYGLQDVSKRFVLGTEDETKERIKLGDTFVWLKEDEADALLATNRYQMYIDVATLFKSAPPGNAKESKINDLVEINSILYAATDDGIATSKDDGVNWLWRKSMIDLVVLGIKTRGSEIWFFSARSIGYSTDDFATVVNVPFTPKYNIVDFEVDTSANQPRVVVCTSNGAYVATFNGTVWSAWSKSPDPATTVTSYTVTLEADPEYLLDPTGHTVKYKSWVHSKPYSNDFRSVGKIGSIFLFATASGIVYTTDFVTWSHDIQMGDGTHVSGALADGSVPNPPSGAVHTRVRVIGNAVYICGAVSTIVSNASPSFTPNAGIGPSLDVYVRDGYYVALKTDRSLLISFDAFGSSVAKSAANGYTGYNVTRVLISPTGRLFLIAPEGLSRSTDLEQKISFTAILKIGDKVEAAYSQQTIRDFTSTVVKGGDTLNQLLFVKGKKCAYVFVGVLNPGAMKWYLYGKQPPDANVQAAQGLKGPFGVG